VAAHGDVAWVAGPKGLMRVGPRSSGASGRVVPVRGTPSTLAVGERAVWVIAAGRLRRLHARTGLPTGPSLTVGAASELAVGPRGVWVASDRVVRRVDPSRAAFAGPRIEAQSHLPSLAAGEAAVWVADLDELEAHDQASGRELRAPLGLSADQLPAADGRVWATEYHSRRVHQTRVESAADRATDMRGEPFALAASGKLAWVLLEAPARPDPLGLAPPDELHLIRPSGESRRVASSTELGEEASLEGSAADRRGAWVVAEWGVSEAAPPGAFRRRPPRGRGPAA
jgi:hypothetical protein